MVLAKILSLQLFLGLQICTATFLGFVDEEVQRHEVDAFIPDVIVNTGGIIELTCAASSSDMVSWQYPRMAEENSTAVTEVSLHTTNSDGELITPYYTSKLILANVTREDSGDYKCFCNGAKMLEHFYGSHLGRTLISELTVYVYVRDNSTLFNGEKQSERMPVTGVVSGTVVFPCGVNHPNVSIELVREKGYNRQSVIPIDGKKYQIDLKTGFTVTNLSIRDAGTYACLASMNEHFVDTRQFYLHVMRARPLLQTPLLIGPASISVGLSTNFKCQVAAGRDQVTAITWWRIINGVEEEIVGSSRVTVEEPLLSESMCSGNRSMCSFKRQLTSNGGLANESQYIRLTGRMRIHNAEYSEEGSYLCKAWSSGLTLSSNVIELRVSGPAVIIPNNNNRNEEEYSIFEEI
ncbi:vascular endothelial growth factor receptor 1-like [Watersipora subatra]|uniref:vascular endothelial growth factor receptor 1-like n=1 Tax=Watersipora subatra TaxID=2589382 RepID=UPI00355C03C5